MPCPIAADIGLVLLGDQRQHQSFVAACTHNMIDKVIFVQPMHDDHDPAIFIAHPRKNLVVERLIDELYFVEVVGVLDREWIVDDDNVGAKACDPSGDGGGVHASASGSSEISGAIPILVDARGECTMITFGCHDLEDGAGLMARLCLVEPHDHDSSGGLVRQDPGRQTYPED